MPTKLYRKFESAIQTLIDGNYFWSKDILKWLYSESEYNAFRSARHADISLKEQLAGMLHPLTDMQRDAIKTLQPYRSRAQAFKDFLQPLRGLINIGLGLTSVVVAAFYLFIVMPSSIILSCCLPDPNAAFGLRAVVEPILKDLVAWPFSWFINGALQICRGAAQIATTPLTWLLRIPLRAAMTAKFGYADFMSSRGMKRLLQITTSEKLNDPTVDSSYEKNILSTQLTAKFFKAQQAGAKLPPALDLTKASTNNLYSFEYAQAYMNGMLIKHVLPEDIKRYFIFKTYMELDNGTKRELVAVISSIMESDATASEKVHDVINVLESHNLYNLHLLTLLANRNHESSFRQIVKPVANIIANMTMFRNTPEIEPPEKEATVFTPLLQDYA